MKSYPNDKTYNKLVRDKIPQIIEEDGLFAQVKSLNKEELILNLKEKLIEEAKELREARGKAEQLKEMADCFEVVYALCEELNIGLKEVETERLARQEKRGGFKKGIFLIKTSSNKKEINE